MTNTKHTLSLTDAEAYILACVMGHLRWNDNPSVNSLLDKIYEVSETFNIDVEDYDRVSAYVDSNGGCEEGYKLCKSLFFTLDFDGSNVDLGENVEFTEEQIKAEREACKKAQETLSMVRDLVDPLAVLYNALVKAVNDFDYMGIESYSKAIQRIQSTL